MVSHISIMTTQMMASQYKISARSTRSGFLSVSKALPEFEKCQDRKFQFTKRHEFFDYKDFSRDPSYTGFKIPYHILCQKRYCDAKSKMEQQFQEEFKLLVRSMESAYEAARFMRHMCITTFWPPLHNRAEIQRSERMFRLSKKRAKRLNYLMTTNII